MPASEISVAAAADLPLPPRPAVDQDEQALNSLSSNSGREPPGLASEIPDDAIIDDEDDEIIDDGSLASDSPDRVKNSGLSPSKKSTQQLRGSRPTQRTSGASAQLSQVQQSQGGGLKKFKKPGGARGGRAASKRRASQHDSGGAPPRHEGAEVHHDDEGPKLVSPKTPDRGSENRAAKKRKVEQVEKVVEGVENDQDDPMMPDDIFDDIFADAGNILLPPEEDPDGISSMGAGASSSVAGGGALALGSSILAEGVPSGFGGAAAASSGTGGAPSSRSLLYEVLKKETSWQPTQEVIDEIFPHIDDSQAPLPVLHKNLIITEGAATESGTVLGPVKKLTARATTKAREIYAKRGGQEEGRGGGAAASSRAKREPSRPPVVFDNSDIVPGELIEIVSSQEEEDIQERVWGSAAASSSRPSSNPPHPKRPAAKQRSSAPAASALPLLHELQRLKHTSTVLEAEDTAQPETKTRLQRLKRNVPDDELPSVITVIRAGSAGSPDAEACRLLYNAVVQGILKKKFASTTWWTHGKQGKINRKSYNWTADAWNAHMKSAAVSVNKLVQDRQGRFLDDLAAAEDRGQDGAEDLRQLLDHFPMPEKWEASYALGNW